MACIVFVLKCWQPGLLLQGIPVYNGGMRQGLSIGGLLLLCGCAANITAPMTMPVWLFFGFFFLTDKSLETVWKIFTYICLAQMGLITMFWLPFSSENGATPLVFFLPISAFIATCFSISMMGNEYNSLRQRQAGYLLQVFSAIGALLPILIVYIMGRN